MPRGTHVHVCCAHAPRAEEEEEQQQAWGKQQAALVVALRHALPDREVTCTGAGGGEVDVEQVGLVVVCASQRLVDAVNGRQAPLWSEWSALVVRKQLPFVVLVVEPEASQEHWTGGFALQAGRAAAVVDLTGEEKGIVEDAVAQIVQYVEQEDDQQGIEDDVVLFAVDGFDPLQVAREKSALYVEGTRAWALDEFRAWANRPASVWASDRVLVFVGPAGFGKSVLMARICDENGLLDDDGADEASSPAKKKRRSVPLPSMLGGKKTQEQTVVKVRAAHFFKHDDKQACDLKTCLLSVANQLAAVLPVYREEIAKLDKNEILHGLGPAVLFDRLIAEPMSNVPEPGERVVVLLDALDEVTEADRGVLLHIVRNLWHTKTPEWLGLVLSTRPEDPIRDTLEVFRLTVLQLDDERNLADLRHFLEMRLRRHLAHVDRDLERAVEILAERAEGLFLYAYFVDQTLVGRESKVASLEELEEVFPDGGIDDMYQSYFSRLLEGPLHGDQELYGVLLGTLVAARSPVPRDVLQAAVRVDDEREFDEILARSEQLLAVGPDAVRFIHKSMSDFVQDRRRAGPRRVVDPGVGHRELARVVVDAPTFMRSSPFLLRHALFHLGQSDMPDALADWLFCFRNLQAALHFGVDAIDLVQDVFKVNVLNLNERKEVIDVARALESAARAVRHDPDELAGQILGRISNPDHPLRLSVEAHWRPRRTWIRPVSSHCLHNTRESLRKLFDHPWPVQCVAFSADCQTLLLAGGDETIESAQDAIVRLIDVESGLEKAVLHGHSDDVRSCAIADDSKTVVSGSLDRSVRLWDAETGAPRSVFRTRSPVLTVAISRDGRVVVSGRLDGVVELWDADTGEELHSLHGHSGGVCGVSISGRTVASGSTDSSVRLWDAQSGALDHILTGHLDLVRGVTISSDSGTVASASYDKTVRIWDAIRGTVKLVFRGHDSAVWGVAISSDGKMVVSGGEDHTVRLWDAETGVENRVFRGHASDVTCVTFSSDANMIASGSDDATVRLWESDLDYGSNEGTSKEQIWELVMSEDISTIASAEDSGRIRVWDACSGAERVNFKAGPFPRLGISCDGKVLSCKTDTTVLWDSRSGTKKLEVFTSNVKMSRSGETAVCWTDAKVQIWDVDSGTQKGSFTHESMQRVVLSDDGHMVVSQSDRAVKLWDVASGLEKLALISNEFQGCFEAVALSFDCKRIATSRSRNEFEEEWAELWDTNTGVRQTSRSCSVAFVMNFALDDSTVVMSCRDGNVRWWDTLSGTDRVKRRIPCRGLCNQDQKAVGFEDEERPGELCLWDMETKERRQLVKGIPCVSFPGVIGFTADGCLWGFRARNIVVCSRGYQVAIFHLDCGQRTEKQDLL
ncbi:Vegetative incompatibility protein HET-E-1 [Durusdinium trenchii]|uniref:Vegetative incompatibility protein HET-E-1 n=1 Tax=Durusdinium trenchii TaxID=1381693 RepID=A0ABP0ILW6_9DINO